jgi:DNA-binding NtrC family response regulator
VTTTPQPRPTTQVVRILRIEVVDGPDRGKHATSSDAIAIGTANDNGLVVGDPTVSRYHLEVEVRPDGIAIADLGSTNGTYLGSARIERALVVPGTQIKLGDSMIRIDDGGRRTVAYGRPRELGGMRAQSPVMLRLFAAVERVAPSASLSSVLIVGESGTGKERVAEALHALSPRAAGPFVTIDCGALPSTLVASELFGHERGAFTGADRTYAGAFERARGGTVFLDEIGELPATDQVALLGVLERRRFRRIGGTTDLELDARVIAATNRDLRAEVNSTRFRHDLYHRIAVVVLRTPALRERPDDIPVLVEMFARELGATGPIEQIFRPELLGSWQLHPWPGNVRELRNAVESALVMGDGIADPSSDGAALDDGDDDDPRPRATIEPYKLARAQAVDTFERPYLERLLDAARGNVSRAARLARMDRSYLSELLRRHAIKR